MPLDVPPHHQARFHDGTRAASRNALSSASPVSTAARTNVTASLTPAPAEPSTSSRQSGGRSAPAGGSGGGRRLGWSCAESIAIRVVWRDKAVDRSVGIHRL